MPFFFFLSVGVLSFLVFGLFEQLVLFPVAFGCRSKRCWNHFQVKQRAFGIRSATNFILKELEIFCWEKKVFLKDSRALTFLEVSPYSSGPLPNSSSLTTEAETGMPLVWSTILWEQCIQPMVNIYRPVCDRSQRCSFGLPKNGAQMIPCPPAGLTLTPAVEADNSALSSALLQGCFLVSRVGSVEDKELGWASGGGEGGVHRQVGCSWWCHDTVEMRSNPPIALCRALPRPPHTAIEPAFATDLPLSTHLQPRTHTISHENGGAAPLDVIRLPWAAEEFLSELCLPVSA